MAGGTCYVFEFRIFSIVIVCIGLDFYNGTYARVTYVCRIDVRTDLVAIAEGNVVFLHNFSGSG